MDICVLNPFFYPYLGGTEKVLLEIYRRLAKRHNITVISATFGKYNTKKTYKEEIEGVKVIRLKTSYIHIPHLPLAMPVMHGLNEMVKKEHADIYHINNRYLYFYKTLNIISKNRAKIALTLHNALPKGIDHFIDGGGMLYDLFWGRRIMKRSNTIVGITKNVVETTVPKNLMKKTSVIFNGVDMEKFKPRKRNNERVRVIKDRFGNSDIVLNVARLTVQKGQIYLLRAFSDLVKERKDIKLLIIGRGPLKNFLMKEAKKLGIEKYFRILSEVDEQMLPYYYNASSVFVLPSLYEPASIALLEALASGTPTVASYVGGIPEMMKKAGRYAKPRNIESIRNSIERVLEEKEHSKVLVHKGLKLMKLEHDWDKIANKYETLFLKVAT